MHSLAVQKRHLQNAKVPTAVYAVETRSGEVRLFNIPTLERRNVATTLELREDAPDDGNIHMRGHAAVFGRKSDDLGGFREVINPGAFKDVLDMHPDVRALFNHNPDKVLGRTRSNTLDLREDPRGLHYYVQAAPTSYARDLEILLKRGDVDQSSFAFSMGTDSRERWEESEDGEIVRTILKVDGLYDVSPVTYPAYPQTDVSTNSAADIADTATIEVEPEVRTDPEATGDAETVQAQETQKLAALDELRAGAQRRLAEAKTSLARSSRP